MSDITLSLGGKWLHQTAEREKQGQMIAHLTNQLEGLRAAYTEDLEQVAANKQLLVTMQEALDKTEQERDEWKAAYNGVVNKRIERDLLVEDMMSKMTTLEVTTRNEELNAADATRKATLLQKEKELLHSKLDKTKKELDEAYTTLAATKDELATHVEATTTLSNSLHTMTRSRDTKEAQVVSLLKEKNRLFRLVTDLRSTIKVAGASLSSSASASTAIRGEKGAASVGEVEDAVSTELAQLSSSVGSRSASSNSNSTKKKRPSHAVSGIGNMIARTLDGTIDRPKWASSAASLKVKTSNTPKTITSQAQLDEMSFQGSVNSNSLLHFGQSGGSRTTTPSKFRPAPSFGDEEKEEEATANTSRISNQLNTQALEDDDIAAGEDRKTVAAKKNLILRLKRQIELLEEKNAELEKSSNLVKNENNLLLVRFRGAHDRRMLVEKKLKSVEKEVEELRSGPSEHADEQDQVNFNHGYWEQHAPNQQQQRQRPNSAAAAGRWK